MIICQILHITHHLKINIFLIFKYKNLKLKLELFDFKIEGLST